jgi:hypothetical protein
MTTPPPDRLRLTLEALPVPGWPASVRWRLLLKLVLRWLRLKCVKVEGAPPGPPAGAVE